MCLITLTTDFGAAAPYGAALKGAVLSIHPHARLVDLSHVLPPQDIVHAAYFLAQAVPYFPAQTIHICVVDPGVGTARALLLAEADGHVFLAPDNGVLTFALDRLHGPATVRHLTATKFWRTTPSATFHGRDILAPVAAHLALGVPQSEFGPVVSTWVRLQEPQPRPTAQGLEGVVTFVDDFGNLITNIPAASISNHSNTVDLGTHIGIPLVPTYGAAPPGSLVALVGSSGRLEVAVVNGNAQRRLDAARNTPVRLHIRSERP